MILVLSVTIIFYNSSTIKLRAVFLRSILFYDCLCFYFLVFLNVSMNAIRLSFCSTKFCTWLVLF